MGAAQVKYEVIQEQRSNSRYSLTQRKAYLRVPFGLPQADIAHQREQFLEWLRKVVDERPRLEAAYTPKVFAHDQVWQLGEHSMRLCLQLGNQRGASARPAPIVPKDGHRRVDITLPRDASPEEQAQLIESLLYKVVASLQQRSVTEEVLALNAAHFRVPVSRVKLSATTSRWGSCSTSGTISLSTRLLGAPEFCRKAVIVHELAHRVEMNHSAAFWNLVYAALPNYEEADVWLKTHGASIGWQRLLLEDS